MRRLNKNILRSILPLLFLVFVFFVPTNTAHAGWLDGVGDVVSFVIQPIALVMLKLTSLLNMLAGVLLNYVVQTTIVDMAKNYASIPAIDSAWKVVRDLANMSFIFVLLYASIQMILGVGKDPRKVIVNTVIAALLMNFSLFFTKVIIDVSNLIALTFYHALAPGAASSTGLDAGLSNTLMEPLNLQSIWTGFSTSGLKPTTVVIVGVMGSIMTLIAAFIFFAISIMFIIRYVILILVLILSPIAVLANIIPSLGTYSKQWWSALLNQSFFAPVYMILTWITVAVFSSMFKGGTTTMVQVFTGVIKSNGTKDIASFPPSSMGVLFGFVVVICFLITTLVVSKSISDKAGLGINKLTSWATGAAGGLVIGGVIGGGLRNTVGRYGASVADDASLQERAKNAEGLGGARARLNLYAARKARSGTFDARNMALPTAAIGDLVEGTVGRTNAGKKLGLDDLNWKSVDIGGKSADQTGVGKGGTTGFKENRSADDKRVRDDQKANEEELRKAQAKVKMSAGVEAAKTTKGSRTPAQDVAVAEMVKAIKDMTDKEIEAQKASTLTIAEVAEELSGRQLEKIQGSENYTESEKKEIFAEHYKKIDGALDAIASGTASADQENLIKNLSDKEIELLPPSSFNPKNPAGTREQAFIKTAGQSQIDGMLKGNKLVSTDKQAIKDAKAAPLKNAFATANFIGPNGAVEIMRKMKPEALVNLDDSQLANPGILELYSPPLLNKLAARSDFSEAKALKVRDQILAAGPTAAVGSNLEKSYNWLIGDGLNIF